MPGIIISVRSAIACTIPARCELIPRAFNQCHIASQCILVVMPWPFNDRNLPIN